MTAVGDLEPEDIMGAVTTMLAHPDFHPDFAGVVDIRQGRIRADLEETQRIAAFVVKHRQDTEARWAYLVTEPRSTAMTTYYGQLIEQKHPARVLYTVEAASDYIGVELSDLLEETF